MHIRIYKYIYIYIGSAKRTHGVATISELLKTIGLFCRIQSLL